MSWADQYPFSVWICYRWSADNHAVKSIHAWLLEHVGPSEYCDASLRGKPESKWMCPESHTAAYISERYIFANAEDAMAFKLVWGVGDG